VPNLSHILGDFTAAAISNLYYPESDRGASLILFNGLADIGRRCRSKPSPRIRFERHHIARHQKQSSISGDRATLHLRFHRHAPFQKSLTPAFSLIFLILPDSSLVFSLYHGAT